ncbi:MAG: MlaD family protein [Imperialibacter sp.]|uniref:MlaD family protein n=1 Tax=Imperialibacter sp. TaxID=2038411 RepID=UPI003A87A170
MSDTSNKRAVIVGLFVFLGLAFLITGILMVGNLHGTFKKKMKIVTFFDDVNGLQNGNNVWFSGVKVGTVSNLHFFGKSQVKVVVNLELKAQEYIRKDAMIKISTDGLIGNKILVIYGGTQRVGEVQEGDTLQVEKTFSSEDMINMLQENNKNVLAITTDFKTISKALADGQGSIGKLLGETALYDNLNATVLALKQAATNAQKLTNTMNQFGANLNKEGTLAHELTTDTVIINSLRLSVAGLKQVTDTAVVFMANLREASSNPKSPVGVLLHDEAAGAHLKETMKNLESSSFKLDEDLEAAQHSFLLRGFFKKREKAEKKVMAGEKGS